MLSVLIFSTLLQSSGNPVTGPLPPSYHLLAGAPGYGLPHNYLLIREGYAALFNDQKKEPLWVEYRLTSDDLSPVQRPRLGPGSGPFKADPDLPTGAGSQLADYSGSGFDRGHMYPSNDARKEGTGIDPDFRQRESFYLSNMTMQNGPLNQHFWAHLESIVHNYANTYGEIEVISGPIFSAHPATKGPNHVAIPTKFFKIAVILSGPNEGHWMAFLVPNQKPPAGAKASTYIKTIGQIETASHLTFFSDLPAQERTDLKAGQLPKLPLPTNDQ